MGGQIISVVFYLVAVLWCSFVYEGSCQTSLSSQDQQELLNAHNHYRGLVSPTASNMETMVWNAELARVAQDYAQQCIFDHNSQRTNQQSTFSYVGENLYITTARARSINYTGSVRNWYDENQDYSYQSNSCNSGAVCGHYTQVVWATSSSLGCGAFRCAQTVGFGGSNALNLVCNYGPGGNFNGRLPYRSGTPCSECSEGLDYCVENLCSSTAESIGSTTTGIIADNTSNANKVQLSGGVIALAAILINFIWTLF